MLVNTKSCKTKISIIWLLFPYPSHYVAHSVLNNVRDTLRIPISTALQLSVLSVPRGLYTKWELNNHVS